MSRSVTVAWKETVEELELRYRAERDVEVRKRLGALWRVRCGDRVGDAGRAMGVGERTVFRWLGGNREDGLAGVLRRVPGRGALGQPPPPRAAHAAALLGGYLLCSI